MQVFEAKRLLGLGDYFTEEELKKAYLEAAKKYHPNFNPSDPKYQNQSRDNQEKMKAINVAKDLLVGYAMPKRNTETNHDSDYDIELKSLLDKFSKIANQKMLKNDYFYIDYNLYLKYKRIEGNIYYRSYVGLNWSISPLNLEEFKTETVLIHVKTKETFVTDVLAAYKKEQRSPFYSPSELEKEFAEVKKNCLAKANTVNDIAKFLNQALYDIEQANIQRSYAFRDEMLARSDAIINTYNLITDIGLDRSRFYQKEASIVAMCMDIRKSPNYYTNKAAADKKITECIELIRGIIETELKNSLEFQKMKEHNENKIRQLSLMATNLFDKDRDEFNENITFLKSILNQKDFDELYEDIKMKAAVLIKITNISNLILKKFQTKMENCDITIISEYIKLLSQVFDLINGIKAGNYSLEIGACLLDISFENIEEDKKRLKEIMLNSFIKSQAEEKEEVKEKR